MSITLTVSDLPGLLEHTMYLELEKQISLYCIQHEMFSDGTVLVALSGGGDSVALLHILVRIRDDLGITVEAAHLNHSMRGDESDRDESFCRDICNEMKIPLTVERLKTGEIFTNKGSVETAARDVRMAFFKRIAEERNATRIATGHTLDDLAETVLQRIIRGTGPSGLSGILPVREGLWVRPMLCISRKEARDYLRDKGIQFCEDSTNKDTGFFRNRIRHELLPFLKKHFSPNITGVLGRLAEISRIQEEYLDKRTSEAYSKCVIHEDTFKILLDKSKFIGYHNTIKQRVIRHCLKMLEGAGRNADMGEIENILNLCYGNSGIADITSNIKCEAGKQFVVFALKLKPFKPLPVKLPGETIIPMGKGRIISEEASKRSKANGSESVVVNQEVIEKYGVLTVGPVKPGDFIQPFGMKKDVKILDIFSSFSIPRIVRNSVPIVRAGAVPIWIPGLRLSECLRINTVNNKKNKCMILTFRDGIQWHRKKH